MELVLVLYHSICTATVFMQTSSGYYSTRCFGWATAITWSSRRAAAAADRGLSGLSSVSDVPDLWLCPAQICLQRSGVLAFIIGSVKRRLKIVSLYGSIVVVCINDIRRAPNEEWAGLYAMCQHRRLLVKPGKAWENRQKNVNFPPTSCS